MLCDVTADLISAPVNHGETGSVVSDSVISDAVTALNLAEAPEVTEGIEDLTGKKLFLGGLSSKTDDELLRAHFGVHGEITDAVVMVDQLSGRSRGFGFVTFFSSESATAACAINYQRIDDKLVEVKPAVPRSEIPDDPKAASRRSKANGNKTDAAPAPDDETSPQKIPQKKEKKKPKRKPPTPDSLKSIYEQLAQQTNALNKYSTQRDAGVQYRNECHLPPPGQHYGYPVPQSLHFSVPYHPSYSHHPTYTVFPTHVPLQYAPQPCSYYPSSGMSFYGQHPMTPPLPPYPELQDGGAPHYMCR